MNAETANPFATFWALGYRRLCPIVPPDAPLNEKSSLAIRMRKDPTKDPRGKAPGILRDDLWQGIDFTKIEPDEEMVHRWATMRAGVGIKTGQGLHLIDADTLNAEHAKIIEAVIIEMIGVLPARIGQFPKIGYLIRVTGDMPYMRVEFGERDEKGRLLDRVEILGEGRQFVAHGIHPKTRKPYAWPHGIPAFDDIPTVPASVLVDTLKEIGRHLPQASPLRIEGATSDSDVDQSKLRGDPAAVKAAIAALPNTTELFPTREAWRDVGYAIKAALPDDEDTALELFQDWSAKWEETGEPDEDGNIGPGNDPDYVAAEFGRMQPPFRRGASWLYELAGHHSGGAFTPASLWVEEPEPAHVPLFPPEEGTADHRALTGAEPDDEYRLITIGDLRRMPDPKFVIHRHIPEKSVGLFYGAFGTGKSFVTLDLALSIAFDFPDWHGDPINVGLDADGNREKVCVIYLAGEGAPGFKARVMAWMQERGIPPEMQDQGRFALIDQQVNFMKPEDVAKVVRTLKRRTGCRVAVVIIDTVARVLPGADENLQKDMGLFVEACDRIRDAFSCAVLGVHHTGKDGSVRGSTVIPGAADFIFRLDRDHGSPVGMLTCEKQKDGTAFWHHSYRFDVVDVEGLASPQGEPLTSVVVSRCEAGDGIEAAGLTPAVSDAVLAALRAAGEAGEPWSRNARAKERFFVRRMTSDFGMTAAAAENLMAVWIGSGVVEERQISTRHKSKGLFIANPVKPASAWTETDPETPKLRSVFD